MEIENRIEKIQQKYFEFCLELLQKTPKEDLEENKLVLKAYRLKDELAKAVTENRKNCKSESIKTLEEEIAKIRVALRNQSLDN
jgi:hypothetical protein